MHANLVVRLQWAVILGLLCIVALQYSVIHQHDIQTEAVSASAKSKAAMTIPQSIQCNTVVPKCECTKSGPTSEITRNTDLNTVGAVQLVPKVYAGAAVTTFLGAPKWFQNRYSLMVNQVLAVLEDDWIVQIFYDPSQKMALEGINYPGIRRQVRRGKVILTPLPSSMKKIKKNALLLSPWFWQSILAERVLLFGGTAALCANSPLEVANFTTQYDYIGAPWGQFQGRGGEGGVAVRNRSVIEAVVRAFDDNRRAQGTDVGTAKEDSVLVRALLEQGNNNGYRVASTEETAVFAANNNIAVGAPLAVSGTLAGLDDAARQQFLDYCPEMKMMFPSVHNAACFGAEPNALECFKYMCITSRLRCGEKFKDISFLNGKNKKVSIHISVE